MRVLIVGASGFVGRHLVGRLTGDGIDVVVAGRSRERLQQMFPGLAVQPCDLGRDTAQDWQSRLSGIDAVVNLAGLIRDSRGASFETVHEHGAMALFDGCLTAGVRRVVQVSALGADETGFTRYHRSKKAADDHLAALDPQGRRMDWAVLRPSLLIGPGGQTKELLSALGAAPLPLRMGPGTWMLQPIHVDDLVEAIARLLRRAEPFARRVDVVGPEPMSTDAVTLALRRWLGLRPAPFLPLPRWVLALAAWAGDRIGLGSATRESLAMLEAGNTAPVAPFVRAFGFVPRALPAALARHPATQADLWAARLLFVRDPLRILLALMWIWTAIVSLGLYPLAESYALLARVGITGALAPLALYGAAALDLVLGLALLMRWRPALVGALQIVLMLGYTALITAFLPELWLHPFGPVSKNLAVAGATLAMMALEAEHG
ncbi:NAD(P)H-binding protein [Arenibaculum pallidiluteum]|uniref:NAD(P)H-binding protein n=1 Tax=Arenibaculum pallidiluteum TaxID=2812559 RepID=UPI001A970A49|nr:NAD(P)H-binding protein [Arenibaculum pallidiluteum]